jgi:hypothetical protein
MPKKINHLIIALVTIVFSHQNFALAEQCSRNDFTQQQLSDPRNAVNLRSIINKDSGELAAKLIQLIESKAQFISNRGSQPCNLIARSCWGDDGSWVYSKDLVMDIFGNVLGLNGEIRSIKPVQQWSEKYYDLHIYSGFTCAWGNNRSPYCEEWCSLTVIDDRFHD